MKKLLICFSLIPLYSCDKVEYVEPTFTTINNVGLPTIKTNEYITCQVQTSTKLAVGQKLTKSEEKFNIAEYKDGALELSFHQVCSGLNPNMNSNHTISCDSYSFSEIKVNKCN